MTQIFKIIATHKKSRKRTPLSAQHISESLEDMDAEHNYYVEEVTQ